MMVLSNDNRVLLTKLTNGYETQTKYYGLKAVDKIKTIFLSACVFDNKQQADKWAKRWTIQEQKKSACVTYFVGTKRHLYAKFIIGDGSRRAVLGQRNIKLTSKTRRSTGILCPRNSKRSRRRASRSKVRPRQSSRPPQRPY